MYDLHRRHVGDPPGSSQRLEQLVEHLSSALHQPFQAFVDYAPNSQLGQWLHGNLGVPFSSRRSEVEAERKHLLYR